MEWHVEIWRFASYIVAIITVVGFAISSLSKRVRQLELENIKKPKRTISECQMLMSRCPLQANIALMSDTLDEIKRDTKDIRKDVQEHIKFHLREKEGN